IGEEERNLLTFLTVSYLTSTVHIITIITVAKARNLLSKMPLELKSCTDEIVKFLISRTAEHNRVYPVELTEIVGLPLWKGICLVNIVVFRRRSRYCLIVSVAGHSGSVSET
ncbi:unnamed protein product, partial [Brassica oleracea]